MAQTPPLDDNWFTEVHEHAGSAFALQIQAKLHEETTPYQTIAIYQTRSFGKLMTIDGCTMVSTRDNFFYHEMMAHPALLSHPNPQRIVIIGGGDCGTLREVLKHGSVKHALQVEIDERVTRLAEEHFPELCEANDDPRAELYFGDGIEWIRNAADASVDVVIVDSTDPIGPAEGLFGKSFYEQVFRILTPQGLLVHQSESPLVHLDLLERMHQDMDQVGFARRYLVSFPQPIYPSGYWSASIAAKSAQPLAPRLDAANGLATRYYSAAIHLAAFAVPPFVATALQLAESD